MVKLIIWIVIGLLALSFFGISLKSLVNSPVNKDNIAFITQLLQQGWTTMISWLHSVIDPLMASIHVHPPF